MCTGMLKDKMPMRSSNFFLPIVENSGSELCSFEISLRFVFLVIMLAYYYYYRTVFCVFYGHLFLAFFVVFWKYIGYAKIGFHESFEDAQ